MAVEAVKKGAGECLVRVVYAPNVEEPLDIQVEASGGDASKTADAFMLVGRQGVKRPESGPKIVTPVPAAPSSSGQGLPLQVSRIP